MAVEGGMRLKKKRIGTLWGKGEKGRKTGIIASRFWRDSRSDLREIKVVGPDGVGAGRNRSSALRELED